MAIRSDAEWQRFAALLGGEATDPRFATLDARLAAADRLDASVAAWTEVRGGAAIEAALQAAGIAAHRASTSADMQADPQLVHRRHYVELPHPQFGRTVVENTRFALSATPARVARAAPLYGQDNEHVLRDLLGYNQARIDTLRAAGTLRTEA